MVQFNIKEIINNKLQLIKLLIIVLAVIILISVLYKSSPRSKLGSFKITSSQKSSSEIDPYFNIDILEKIEAKSINSKRDLFRFYQEPPKVSDQPPPPPPVQVVEEKNPVEQIPKEEIQEPPSMMNLKLFGILSRDGKQIFAFISDGNEIYVVTKDNIFANQYKVVYIDEEKIEIMALKNNYKKTLIYTGGKQT